MRALRPRLDVHLESEGAGEDSTQHGVVVPEEDANTQRQHFDVVIARASWGSLGCA